MQDGIEDPWGFGFECISFGGL